MLSSTYREDEIVSTSEDIPRKRVLLHIISLNALIRHVKCLFREVDFLSCEFVAVKL